MDRLTKYQLEFLQVVEAASPEDEGPVDFDQLLERLSWKPTKASAHFSVRALVKRGLVRKTDELMLRRGRMRVGFELTKEGRQALDPRPAAVESAAGAPKAHSGDESPLPGLDQPELNLEEALSDLFPVSIEEG